MPWVYAHVARLYGHSGQARPPVKLESYDRCVGGVNKTGWMVKEQKNKFDENYFTPRMGGRGRGREREKIGSFLLDQMATFPSMKWSN